MTEIKTLKDDLATNGPIAIAGHFVTPDHWPVGGIIYDARDEDESWAVRLPGRLCDYPLARVEVTGRSIDWAVDGGRVRARITFMDSGDVTGAWIHLGL